MLDTQVFVTVALPFFVAFALLFIKSQGLRGMVVTATAAILAVASLGLLGKDIFTLNPETFLGIGLDGLIGLADFLLLFVILYYAFKLKSALIVGLTLAQVVGLAYLEFFLMDHGKVVPGFYVDNLSIIMVLIISIIGSLICVYALGYMKGHEEHLHLEKTRQPRFFFFLVLFLGAMNGLVLSNKLHWLYFFWEITTFCSFMLISHDGTEEAVTNAKRALWMNMLGGVAFVFALIFIQKSTGSLSLQDLLVKGANPAAQAALIPLFLLCFAGFTKAAQVPFQSWLTGAMVAPTPVSALLHSSTMVKAGVYLIVRLAPAYAGTELSNFIALFGAFTFLTTSALAVGQSNGKKILAYSTIANLGLIIACAGVNTPAAIGAAIMLIIFHAVSKGLLFLCVGSIEQFIGSRDIEDMRGLYARMPKTAIITIIGILTMLLPPFGVLLAKWMAIESASRLLLVVLMMAMGSALTVVFWARWAGILMSNTYQKVAPAPEYRPLSIQFPLVVLAGMAVLLSFLAPFVYSGLVQPVLEHFYTTKGFVSQGGGLVSTSGMFLVYPIFVLLGLGLFYAWSKAKKIAVVDASDPYMCGAQSVQQGQAGFIGPLRAFVPPAASNYYLSWIFGEDVLAKWINVIALVLLVVTLGGVLYG